MNASIRACFVLSLLLGAVPAHASCLSELGKVAADRLVRRCLDVSPATRPPCNAENSCALIVDEITRGCGFAEDDAPGWCKDYQAR